MNMPSTLNSRTTQNVAATAGPVTAAIAWCVAVAFDKWELPGGLAGQAALVGVLALIVVPLVSRLVAFIRTPSKNAERPSARWPGVLLVVGAVGAMTAMGGCITDSGMASVRGRTCLKLEFQDDQQIDALLDAEGNIVTPAGHSQTSFSIDAKAPAGVEFKDVAGMIYSWKDGNGEIVINSDATIDSAKQAEMIPQVTALNAALAQQMYGDTMGLLGVLGEYAAPLVGAKIASDARQNELDAKLKAQRQEAFAAMMRDVIAGSGATTTEGP